MAGDHIGVPLDHDRPTDTGDRSLGSIEPVEESRLLVELGLGRVEVLRPLALEQPPTESDRVAPQIVDGEEHTAVEPVA